ncbi:MAG: porin, partial [Alphaproteobacteria bacterium]|nr:porin [Alphaproteobacteria bacterium]
MRKALLATASGAALLAAGPALADDMADKLTVGVTGYMEQWIGGSSVDATDKDGNGTAVDGGVSQYSDSEIIFKGSLEADNGLKFSVKVELEANSSEGKMATPRGDQIDESQATVSGAFGEIQIGSEDHAASLMHYGNKDVGVGLNCGDASFISGVTSCAREGSLGLGTSGWLIGGDDQKISYFTPRMEGVQFGLSYVPDTRSEDGTDEDGGYGSPKNNDQDAVAVGLNYMGSIGDTSVALSAGHYVASQANAAAMMVFDGLMPGATATAPRVDSTYTAEMQTTDAAAVKAFDEAFAAGNPTVGGLVDDAATAQTRITAHQVSMSKADERTFTNFGLQVGFGAFSFDAAYAMHDGGAYKAMRSDVGPGGTAPTPDDASTEDEDESAGNIVREVVVKDGSKDYEVV